MFTCLLAFNFLSLFLLLSPSFALTIPEKPQSYVNDYATLLSEPARMKIEETLSGFEKESSNQIVVAIFNSLEGGSLEDFSIRLAEKWKPGQKDKDNGIILLIFKEDRAVRIEVGYGLEGALPDALASQIIQNEIVPAFQSGNFDKGVMDAVNAIVSATRGEYQPTPQSDPFEKWSPLVFVVMVTYFLLPVVSYLLIVLIGVSLFGMPLGFIGSIVLIAVLAVLRSLIGSPAFGQTYSGHGHGGYWGGGSSGRGFGGGFGGFSGGGGGFGGGGASGRW